MAKAEDDQKLRNPKIGSDVETTPLAAGIKSKRITLQASATNQGASRTIYKMKNRNSQLFNNQTVDTQQ